MLAHIGDVDVMYYRSTELAIPRGHPPPTQLPDEFNNYVNVFEIIDSHLPGYVYLELRYLLTECVDQCNAVECELGMFLVNICSNPDAVTHGPAILVSNSSTSGIPVDSVGCVRCLVWPPQAADWLTRHRSYGWPDSATVDRVVSNGCDVVAVAHRQCRQHEWMGIRQWRLSFSRAEIVLLNSWMPVQQIVYHVLRVFMKTERLTESADNSEAGTLSNYHIKTLMLRACEQKSHTWWTSELNVVRTCVHLLHILANFLTNKRCQHYFISKCNLIDNSFNLTTIRTYLMSRDERWLSKWFVDSYIRKCSQLCPDKISRLFDDVSTTTKLNDAVSAVVAWRRNNCMANLCVMSGTSERLIISGVNVTPLCARSCVCWMTELMINPHLSIFFSAVALLQVAYKSLKYGLGKELLDIIATLLGQVVHGRRYSTTSTSLLSVAANMMRIVVNKSRNTTSLIAIELSKAYLYRALRCEDSDSDSIYCLANVYLAVLYYTTGHYQSAVDHCTLVMRSQGHSECSSHVVGLQGELLPKIHHDIDNVLGLAVLYQHVRTIALKGERARVQHVSVFSTELFVHYLHIIGLSRTVFLHCTEDASLNDEICHYRNSVKYSEQLLIGDVILFLLLSYSLQTSYYKPGWQQLQQSTVNETSEQVTPDLVELLQRSAVEHLKQFRQNQERVFGSVATIVTTDFEALYAYKRGDYQQCLLLSTQNVRTLLYAGRMPDIETFPEFIQLLDDDIVSLTALTLIVNPGCRYDSSKFVCITQLTLSLYLMSQCQLKLHHSVMSLAQTLHYIKVAHRRHPVSFAINRMVLKMIGRKAVLYIKHRDE